MRLRRKSETAPSEDNLDETPTVPLGPGPHDSRDIDTEEGGYVDLGSLRLIPTEGMELRLQVDEESGGVLAVLMVGEAGAVELRAFASPEDGDIWTDARREIAADTAQRGGTATEVEGPFGPELECQLPVTTPEGATGVQASRVVGITGPRWFLRASLMGEPAVDRAAAGVWEDAIRGVVVHRGSEAKMVGEALALHLPPEARRVD